MNAERAENDLEPLEPIGLHEARHTFASLMIAAHLMPGKEEEAAALLDAYLERTETATRLAQLSKAT